MPDRVSEFQDGVGKAVEYATALGCTQLNCLAGKTPAGAESSKVHDTLIANLRFAARELEKVGVRLLVEPCNTQDIPSFHISRTAQALRIIDEVGSRNVALLYDIYHMQIMEGNLTKTIRDHLARIAHMQLADNPGRHEPGTGEINYPNLFTAIDEAGYTGWIGCEYRPQTTTVESLRWLNALGGRA